MAGYTINDGDIIYGYHRTATANGQLIDDATVVSGGILGFGLSGEIVDFGDFVSGFQAVISVGLSIASEDCVSGNKYGYADGIAFESEDYVSGDPAFLGYCLPEPSSPRPLFGQFYPRRL